MKATDALLKRWEVILARKGDAPAIFNTRGQINRTFRAIDEYARKFESKIDSFAAGSVIAVQIGNHEDWPSILIACLRRGMIVLPLEQSISGQQRDAALKICNASGVVAAAVTGGRDLEVLPIGTSAATTSRPFLHRQSSAPLDLLISTHRTANCARPIRTCRS